MPRIFRQKARIKMKVRKGFDLLGWMIVICLIGITIPAIMSVIREAEIRKNSFSVTILGTPLSAEVVSGTHGMTGMSCVIQKKEIIIETPTLQDSKSLSELENTETFLCQSNLRVALKLTDATSLITSEMNDGDSELVEITGIWRGDRVIIEKVSANGETVKMIYD